MQYNKDRRKGIVTMKLLIRAVKLHLYAPSFYPRLAPMLMHTIDTERAKIISVVKECLY